MPLFYRNQTHLRHDRRVGDCVPSRRTIYQKWRCNCSTTAVSIHDRQLRPRRRHAPVVRTSHNLCNFSSNLVHRWEVNDRDWHWPEPRGRPEHEHIRINLSAYFTNVSVNASFLKTTIHRMFLIVKVSEGNKPYSKILHKCLHSDDRQQHEITDTQIRSFIFNGICRHLKEKHSIFRAFLLLSLIHGCLVPQFDHTPTEREKGADLGHVRKKQHDLQEDSLCYKARNAWERDERGRRNLRKICCSSDWGFSRRVHCAGEKTVEYLYSRLGKQGFVDCFCEKTRFLMKSKIQIKLSDIDGPLACFHRLKQQRSAKWQSWGSYKVSLSRVHRSTLYLIVVGNSSKSDRCRRSPEKSLFSCFFTCASDEHPVRSWEIDQGDQTKRETASLPWRKNTVQLIPRMEGQTE